MVMALLARQQACGQPGAACVLQSSEELLHGGTIACDAGDCGGGARGRVMQGIVVEVRGGVSCRGLWWRCAEGL